MAYFFITDDNKIYAAGKNYYGQAGVGTKNTNSTYNYALYPPQEIVYELSDGTILDGSMVKDIAPFRQCSVLLTTDGRVYSAGDKDYTGLGKDCTKFERVLLDDKGEEIPPIKKMCCSVNSASLITYDGVMYNCSASYIGDGSTGSIKKYTKIIEDVDGNTLPKVDSVFTSGSGKAFISEDGDVYVWGTSHVDTIIDTKPRKIGLKNVVKVVMFKSGIAFLDKFGELWLCGGLSYYNIKSFSGQYFTGTNMYPLTNVKELSIQQCNVVIEGKSSKEPFPKKIIDIFSLEGHLCVKYLDEDDGKIHILTGYSTHKYLGYGTTTKTGVLYDARSNTGINDFDNTYTGLYFLDELAVASFTKDGKLYVAGCKGANGTTSDLFTSAEELAGTENLNITRFFSPFSYKAELKDELYPMPDISKAKVKINSMI